MIRQLAFGIALGCFYTAAAVGFVGYALARWSRPIEQTTEEPDA